MKLKVLQLYTQLKSSFWAIPVFGLIAAAALAILNLSLDAFLFKNTVPTTWFLNASNLDSVQTLFATTAGAVIGVLGLTFSITITTLVLATQQFGPHILRTFMERNVVKCVLAVFSGTSLYAVLGLFFSSTFDASSITPSISILTLLVLIIVNLVMLIVFIHQTAKAIQVESITNQILDDYIERSSNLFPIQGEEHQESVPKQVDDFDAKTTLRSTQTGYIQYIKFAELIACVREHEQIVRLLVQAGDYVMEHRPVAEVNSEDVDFDIMKYLVVGPIATPMQDIRYPIQQLVEIALRALSPGINDPFTAMICIDRLSAIAVHTATLDTTAPHGVDEDDNLFVIHQHINYGDFIKLCFDQIRTDGGMRFDIIDYLTNTFETIFQSTDSHTDGALLRQLRLLRQHATALSQPTDREELIRKIDRVSTALQSR